MTVATYRVEQEAIVGKRTLRRVGRSIGATIPESMAERLHLQAGHVARGHDHDPLRRGAGSPEDAEAMR